MILGALLANRSQHKARYGELLTSDENRSIKHDRGCGHGDEDSEKADHECRFPFAVLVHVFVGVVFLMDSVVSCGVQSVAVAGVVGGHGLKYQEVLCLRCVESGFWGGKLVGRYDRRVISRY